MHISKLKANSGKYCSRKCFYEFRKGITINCKTCGKSFYVQNWQFRGNPKFCSRECCSKDRIGSKRPKGANSHMWKGGKHKINEGYIKIYCPNHPSANGQYMLEHILVIEKAIGRPLKNGETAHHINGNKSDNRPENLYLFADNSSHIQYHWDVRKNKINKITKSNLRVWF